MDGLDNGVEINETNQTTEAMKAILVRLFEYAWGGVQDCPVARIDHGSIISPNAICFISKSNQAMQSIHQIPSLTRLCKYSQCGSLTARERRRVLSLAPKTWSPNRKAALLVGSYHFQSFIVSAVKNG